MKGQGHVCGQVQRIIPWVNAFQPLDILYFNLRL